MKIHHRATARALDALLRRADRLHPGVLLLLVLTLAGLVCIAAPIVVTLLTALVTAVKASALLGGGAVLARLAIRAANDYRSAAPAGPPAATP
ncbi:hypothetical protein [Streptomyces klenkii]